MVALHAGPSFLQFKIAVPVRKVLWASCARYRFRKAGGISASAQKNNPKAVVLIARARRIKFDNNDRHRLRNAAGFCKQPAKRGSPY